MPRTVPGHVGQAQQLVGDSHIEAKDKRTYFERNDPFALSLWLRIDRKGASGPLVTRSGGLFDGNRGYEIMLRGDGTFSAALQPRLPRQLDRDRDDATAGAGGWHHLALTYDGSSRARGLRLFFDGQLADTRVVVDNLQQSILTERRQEERDVGAATRRCGLARRHDETLQDVTVDELRVYDRQLTAFEVAALAGIEDPIGESCASPKRSAPTRERAALAEYYTGARRAGICDAVQGADGGSRQGERHPHLAARSDGDARAADAAADVRPRARRLRCADGARDAGHACKPSATSPPSCRRTASDSRDGC